MEPSNDKNAASNPENDIIDTEQTPQNLDSIPDEDVDDTKEKMLENSDE